MSEKVLERKLSPFDRSLDMHVSNLRKKLGNRANDAEIFNNISSFCYIYTLPV